MGEKHIDLAKHCIGLDRKKPYTRHGKKFYKPYRNYYDAGGRDVDIWNDMYKLGYAGRGKKDRYGGYMFWMTREGLDWLGTELGIKIWDEEE